MGRTEDIQEEPFEPLPTVIRVHNGGGATRARMDPCAAPFMYPIRRSETAPAPAVCTLAPDCETLETDETVPRDMCSEPSCLGARIELDADASEELTWDGVLKQGSERGCWERVSLERGTPLTARVCWGTPTGFSDVSGFSCQDVAFQYGDESVDAELE
ncbi:MAG TPA: hypothetical protein VFZ61_34280 [Polyangiales bacterium]